MGQSSYLIHYASKYYDPVKAHEYYMKNRELKERSSTTDLNEEGKNAAAYIKEQVNAERDRNIESRRNQYVSDVDREKKSKDSKIEAHKMKMDSEINSLRNRLAHMTKEQKWNNRAKIQEEIAKLRQDNAIERAKLNENFSDQRSKMNVSYKTDTGKIRSNANETYLKELDKIKQNSAFTTKSSNKNTGRSYSSYSKAEKKAIQDKVTKAIEDNKKNKNKK